MARGMGHVGAVSRWFLVLGLLSSVLVISRPAHACSCAAGDLDRSIRETEGAFVGTYLGRNAIGDYRFTVTFDVERVIKGEFGPRAVVRTNDMGGPCGIEPLNGTRMGLLLVRADDGVWESGLCQQVPPDELLAVASGSHPPDPSVGVNDPTPALIRWRWAIIALVAAAPAVVVLVWVIRRRSSSPGRAR